MHIYGKAEMMSRPLHEAQTKAWPSGVIGGVESADTSPERQQNEKGLKRKRKPPRVTFFFLPAEGKRSPASMNAAALVRTES